MFCSLTVRGIKIKCSQSVKQFVRFYLNLSPVNKVVSMSRTIFRKADNTFKVILCSLALASVASAERFSLREFNSRQQPQVIDHRSEMKVAGGVIAFRFNPLDSSRRQVLFTKNGWDDISPDELSIWLDQSRLFVKIQNGSEVEEIASPEIVVSGKDHRVALRFGKRGLKLFVNRALVASSDYRGGLSDNEHPIVVGGVLSRDFEGQELDPSVVFNGKIKALRIKTKKRQSSQRRFRANGKALADLVLAQSLDLPSGFSLGDFRVDRQPFVIEHRKGMEIQNGEVRFKIKADNVNNYQGLFSKDGSGFQQGGHLSILLHQGKITARIQSSTSSYKINSASIIRPRQEYQIRVQFGKEGFRLFIDDDLVAQNSFTGGLVGNIQPVLIGGLGSRNSYGKADSLRFPFRGWISNVYMENSDIVVAVPTNTSTPRLPDLTNTPTSFPTATATPFVEPTQNIAPEETIMPPPVNASTPLIEATSTPLPTILPTLMPSPQGTKDRPLRFEINDYSSAGSPQVIAHKAGMEGVDGEVKFSFIANDVNNYAGLFSKDGNGFQQGGHLSVRLSEGRVHARIQSASQSYEISSLTPLSTGREYQVTVRFGAEGFKLLLDNQEIASSPYTGGLLGNTQPILLGALGSRSSFEKADSIQFPFNGRIFKAALIVGSDGQSGKPISTPVSVPTEEPEVPVATTAPTQSPTNEPPPPAATAVPTPLPTVVSTVGSPQVGERSFSIPLTNWDSQGGVVAYDVDSDGDRDLVLSQPEAVMAIDATSGAELWTVRGASVWLSTSSERYGLPGSQGPGLAVGDVDADGVIEVLWITRDNRLRVIDGRSGQTERTLSLPTPPANTLNSRWEHVVVANFRGEGDRDILLQTSASTDNDRSYHRDKHQYAFRYSDLALSQQGAAPLWKVDDFVSLSHGVGRVFDLDGDGRDEVVGGSILSSEGRFLHSVIGNTSFPHLDSLSVGDIDPTISGIEVVSPQESGTPYVFLYNKQDKIWQSNHRSSGSLPGETAKDGDKVQIGDFDTSRLGLEMWFRGGNSATQTVLDRQGNEIARYSWNSSRIGGNGVESIHRIRWTGGAKEHLAGKARHVAGNVAIFDALSGDIVFKVEAQAQRVFVADVTGDWREELIVVENGRIRIFVNNQTNPDPQRQSLWADPNYKRIKVVWNYYSS